jgi:hypothetical protein
MGKITKACLAQTGVQNEFKQNGQKYFWEYNAVTHKDGSITGSIYKLTASGHHTRAGTFKISGDGKTVTGTGMAALAGASGAKPAVKKERFTLQKYKYSGWHNTSTAANGEIVYVDLANKHPDPLKKLLWGYRKNGEVAGGDYIGFFTKVGKPVTFEFEQTGKYAMEERGVRERAILRAIKSGRI